MNIVILSSVILNGVIVTMENSIRENKKRRASRPKVRTGCDACKGRRIKCDETKPECYRCQEYGSLCQYNALQSRLASPNSARNIRSDLVSILPRLTPHHIPNSSMSCDEIEGQYFRLFLEKLAFDLCGDSETPLWSHLIPQQCQHEQAIKHAVLAVSALYKSALSCDTHTVNSHDDHFKFALVQQSQAISLLRRTLSSGISDMRLALISSLLFGCFEGFHGNWVTATRQIHSGLNILRRMEEETEKGANGIVDIDLEVGQTLSRLKLQILSFHALNPMCELLFDDSNHDQVLGELPERFASVNEAFTSATALASFILRFSRASARNGGLAIPPERIARQQDFLRRSVNKWNRAYEPVLREACEKATHRLYIGALQLRICIWKCEIIIATAMSDSERVFDDFTRQFQKITHFARHVLQRDQEVRKSDSPRVQYGRGLIMALFYTATRCRDFTVRREAIAVLRDWPCTNGIWHSLQAAKVAEWVVEMEERCCDEHGYIHESRRIRMNSLNVAFQNDMVLVDCMQPSEDGSLEMHKTHFR